MKYTDMICIFCDCEFKLRDYKPDMVYSCPYCGRTGQVMTKEQRKKIMEREKRLVGRPKNRYFNRTILKDE